MLSSVLNSDKAIQVNIQIIRIFKYIKELEKEKLQNSEQQNRKKLASNDKKNHFQFSVSLSISLIEIFDQLRALAQLNHR